MVQARNVGLFAKECLELNRVRLERGWRVVVVAAPAWVATRQRGLNEQRTTSQMGMKTTQRAAVCVESRLAIERTLYRLGNRGLAAR